MRGLNLGRHSFLYTKNTARRRPARVCTPPARECPELGREAFVFECLECEKYAIWHEKDEYRTCYYEFKELESRGHYDGTWDDHPENFDPETFARIQEQKRWNEQVNMELETEWQDLERRAEELAEKDSHVNGDRGIGNGKEPEEEEEPDHDEEDEEEDF